MSNPKFVSLNILRFVPPGNANRDQAGMPKSAVIGGQVRLRHSSQSKNAALEDVIREDSRFEALRDFFNASLTREAADLISEQLVIHGLDKAEADRLALEFKETVLFPQAPKAKNEAEKKKEKKAKAKAAKEAKAAEKKAKKIAESGEDEETEDQTPETAEQAQEEEAERKFSLFRITHSEIIWIAERIAESKSATFGKTVAAAKKMLTDRFDDRHNPDSFIVSLLGRMNASLNYNGDSLLYTTHALATHSQPSEPDYFTGFDRITQKTAHIGVRDFGSSVMYECSVIDVENALRTRDDVPIETRRELLSLLIRAIMRATPKGQRAKQFCDSPASYVVAMGWNAHPMTMYAAFESNIKPDRDEVGYVNPSIRALDRRIKQVVSSYGEELSACVLATFSLEDGTSTMTFSEDIANAVL